MRRCNSRPLCFIVFAAIGCVQAENSYLRQPHTFENYTNRYTHGQLAPILKPGASFYVSPRGDDRSAGSRNSPFRTLAAARDAIRKLKNSTGLPAGGVHVVLLEGNYLCDTTFELTADDAGTAKAPIVYRAEQAGRVILSGGVELDSRRFKRVADKHELERLHPAARGKVLGIDLIDDDMASFFPGDGTYGLISMDGHLLQPARWPNRGYHHIDKILDKGPTTRWLKPGEKPAAYSKEHPTGGSFTFRETMASAVRREFERTGDMRAQGYFHNDWYFQNEPVGRIDNDRVQLLRYTRYGIANKIKSIPRRVRLVNVLCELDEPGEWYFDKRSRRLYAWPIHGFEPGRSRVTVLGGPPLIRMKDTAYITVRDITFENTGGLAVQISGGRYNLLGGCVVRNGLVRGASINGGRYNGITGCGFHDLDNAFNISGGDMKTLEHCYNFATNNRIHSCRRRGYGMIGLSGVGIYFAHNLLYNMNGAISYKTVNLLMEYNEFYHIGYEMGDFNVAYCGAQWYTMNNVVRYNFVHHLLEPGGHPVCGFRNDDGGAGLKIYGNVFYRPGRGAGQFHGPLNDFQNNIVLDCSVMWWTNKSAITPKAIRKKWDDLARFGRDLPEGDKGDYLYILERTIGKKAWLENPWKDAFPELGRMISTNPWAQTFCNVNRNYAYRVRELFHIHGGSGTVEGLESKKTGRFVDLPKEGNFEPPKPVDLDAFVDAAALDFRFKAGFKPMERFKPIPFERIGLIKDAFRPNPPDKRAYRKAVYERFKNDRTRHYDSAIVNSRYPIPGYLAAPSVKSVEVEPFTLPALVGTHVSPIVKLKIVTAGRSESLSLTKLRVKLHGAVDAVDTRSLFIRREGSKYYEKLPAQTISPPLQPGAPLVYVKISGAADSAEGALAEGENTVWVACKIKRNVNIDHMLGGTILHVGFSNGQEFDIDAPPSMQRLGIALRKGGDEGVHTYRIPGLATTNKGTLIGVYDVRHRKSGDLPGDIDVGMSRSTDGGRTWERMKIIMDMGNDPARRYDGIGDPAVLVDGNTGTIWVAATWSHGDRSWRGSGPGFESEETGQLMLVRSDDDGVSWSAPINITRQVKQREWCFILQGPGKGITMRDGTLVFAAQYQDPPDKRRLPHSTIIYSQDHGMTWRIGTGAFDDTTEAQVVEITPGVLMLNCRYNRASSRVVMTTNDMGRTWREHATSRRALIEPRACMAGLIDVDREVGKNAGGWLLFSNPDSVKGRRRITIKASRDRGLTWPKEHRLLLDEGGCAGYSCMTMIDAHTIGILYEGSQAHMTFQRIPLGAVIGRSPESK